MALCETCGNDYDRLMRVEIDGVTHLFDCFECAIHKLAPLCAHCGTRVIGHGVEADAVVFCSAHCSRVAGMTGLNDRLAAKRAV